MSNSTTTNNDLFAVSTLFSHACYRGLYVDKHLHLWARNQNGRYRRQANQWSLPYGDYPHSLAELRALIGESKVFADFLANVCVALAEHQTETTSMKGKFVIAIIIDGVPSFHQRPQVINTREEADLKLMRYQQLHPNERFCLFECQGEVKSVGVVLG